MKKKKNKEFYVSLKGINLTEQQNSRIEKGIQEVVLKELMTLKEIPDNSILLTKFPNLKGTTMGMWMPHKDSVIRIK